MIFATPYDWDWPEAEKVVNALQQAARLDEEEPAKGPWNIYVDYQGRVYVRPAGQEAPFRCMLLCRLSVQLIGKVINEEQT